MAYILFCRHHWEPERYINASIQQKLVYRAFAIKENEDIQDELDEAEI
jgi:hypothetical protein